MTPLDHGRPLRGYRVLIVEDQYLVADELRRAVQQLGGQVAGPIPDLAGALDCVENETIDLALLDINLGEREIYPVAKELLHRKVPYMFATGCEAWIIPEEHQGILRVEKPVTTKALADAIRRLGMQPRP